MSFRFVCDAGLSLCFTDVISCEMFKNPARNNGSWSKWSHIPSMYGMFYLHVPQTSTINVGKLYHSHRHRSYGIWDVHPQRLTAWTWKWCFGRWCSFSKGARILRFQPLPLVAPRAKAWMHFATSGRSVPKVRITTEKSRPVRWSQRGKILGTQPKKTYRQILSWWWFRHPAVDLVDGGSEIRRLIATSWGW